MAEPIDFYFDFSSPYSYLASEKIDALAGRFDREVRWRPILLGVIFKGLGTVSLVRQPGMHDYSLRDFAVRHASSACPFACRCAFPSPPWRRRAPTTGCTTAIGPWPASSPMRCSAPISPKATTSPNRPRCCTWPRCSASSPLPCPPRIEEPAIKERLRKETDAAIALGMFGAPWIVVDGEPFWGADRLPQIEQWLERGGF